MKRRAKAIAALSALLAFYTGAAAQETDASCEPQDLDVLAGWDGVWLAEGQETDISGRDATRATHFFGVDAPWNDAGWDRMRANFAVMMSGNFAQSGFGYPGMMDNFSELSFFIGPRQTVILNAYRETRVVYTDGRDHVPFDLAFPTTWGDAIGCWEGDTLTIETVGVHFDRGFNPAAAPLSDEARFEERLRLVAPGRIEMQMMITDPVYLTAPWTVETAYNRYDSVDRLLVDGALNDRSLVGADQSIAPAADGGAGDPAIAPIYPIDAATLAHFAGRYRFDESGATMVIRQHRTRLFVASPFARFASEPLFFESPNHAESLTGQGFTFTVAASGLATHVVLKMPDGSEMIAERIED